MYANQELNVRCTRNSRSVNEVAAIRYQLSSDLAKQKNGLEPIL
ncbi:MAG: hypothetical protein JWR12_1510 [Mucilaginibacter sp.]|nr:hypothetical protein [Mucilaginibacter sp.]